MFDRHWDLPDEDAAAIRALAGEAGLHPLTAAVLRRRGLVTAADAKRFLTPRLDDLEDPSVILGMTPAALRIAKAVREGEPICICGDYDVDGSTGTALLLRFFRCIGVDARFHIPHRVRDGYGIRPDAVERLAAEGVKVLVTVDNGISAVDAAVRAKALGLDLIITDHHEPPEHLPEVFALINPKQAGCPSRYKELCGASLAFKLAWAVAKAVGPGGKASPEVRDFLLEALALAALATVADVAPLDGENRVITRFGLEALGRTRLPGLMALKALAGVDGVMTARDVGFGLGPRLNAGGRLADAALTVRLLTTEDAGEARRLADELEALNRDRREVERQVVEAAVARVGDPPPPVIALGDAGWHLGVLGIAASRLAERYVRPALLVSWDEASGLGRGSGRSVRGFDLTAALAKAKRHLVAYGGHAYAAGFTVKREAFDAVAASVAEDLAAWAGEAAPRRRVAPDVVVGLDGLPPEAVAQLAYLAPHGEGNPEPVVAAMGLRLAGAPTRMGKEGSHLSFLVRQGEGPSLRVVAFRQGAGAGRLEAMGAAFDMAFVPRINSWKGRQSVELEAVAVRPAGG